MDVVSDEFGSFTGAEGDVNDELETLRAEVKSLKEEKNVSELEFGQKRAQFMELFRQKEDELQESKSLLGNMEKERQKLQEMLERVRTEIDDVKTAAAISEASREDEVDDLRRRYMGEINSMQLIMKDAVSQASEAASQAVNQTTPQSDLEIRTPWPKGVERPENDLTERSKEREGFLTSVAKTLQKKVGGTAAALTGDHVAESENLEDSMRKAQQDAEMLKSIVMPMEEEIAMLKGKLRQACSYLEQYEQQFGNLPEPEESEETQLSSSALLEDVSSSLDDKVKELSQHLQTEKVSRLDLEMYVSVLQTQKTVLQEDADKLRAQLHEVCRLLEQEKREHTDLKCTWQMANDQFLESQRLMMMDMRRMETVLSAEQQRRLTELKERDAEREAQEKRVQQLEEMQRKEQEEQARRRLEEEKRRTSKDAIDGNLANMPAMSSNSLNSPTSDLMKFDDRMGSPSIRRSQSNQSFSSFTHELLEGGGDTRSLGGDDSTSRGSPERAMHIPTLTQAQQRSITDPTPEAEASQSLLASVRAKIDPISMVGKRLVSEKEWELLQKDVKAAREKLGRSCDMCKNYEDQLQTAQQAEKKAQGQTRTLERHLESERHTSANQQKYITELEDNLKQAAESAAKEVTSLLTKTHDAEHFITGLKQQFTQSQNELHDHTKTLSENREQVQKELTRLQIENDSLVGKHSKLAQEMQDENINLPDNMEDLQLTLLRTREELITAKVAVEHTAETLRSQILFLKDQVKAEQQEKGTMEDTLSADISSLQEELAKLQSVKSEFDRVSSLRTDAEQKLKDAENVLKNTQAKSRQLINALQIQLESQTDTRNKLETEVQINKAKIQALQMDLDNSEAVQRDFVKLSQSLQIQLEKIRAGEHEVRWQHEEDVDDCSSCRQQFTVTRRKHHCKHCGRIFCADCLAKNVNSGPNLRPSRVCDVCHTILVRDATPYFSTDPPHTPD